MMIARRKFLTGVVTAGGIGLPGCGGESPDTDDGDDEERATRTSSDCGSSSTPNDPETTNDEPEIDLKAVIDDAGTLHVEGTSDLPPGTDLIIRARVEDQPPYILAKDVVVGEGGTFSADLDFSDVPNGTEFTLTVRSFANECHEVEGIAIQGGGAPSSAEFNVSNFAAPTNVTVGEDVEVSASVQNVGESSGTVTVGLILEGKVVDSREVSLDADSSKRVTLHFGTDSLSTGEITVRVVAGGHSTSQTVTIRE